MSSSAMAKGWIMLFGFEIACLVLKFESVVQEPRLGFCAVQQLCLEYCICIFTRHFSRHSCCKAVSFGVQNHVGYHIDGAGVADWSHAVLFSNLATCVN